MSRKEHRLRVFENMVLKRLPGPKRDELKYWSRMHKEELYDLYSLPNIFRVIEPKN
jgi:hypothetical protein